MHLSLLLAAARGREQADALQAAVDRGAANGKHIVVDHSNARTPATSATPGALAALAAHAAPNNDEPESTASPIDYMRKWTKEEDRLLLSLVAKHGTRS